MKKKLPLSAVLLMACLHLSAQTCPISGFSFNSQAEVDFFPSLYPNCTQLEDITIYGSDITNLDSLRGLVDVKYLRIKANPLLESIEGLGNLTSLQSLEVYKNPVLVDLHGLDNLTTLRSALIYYNPALENLTGLQNIQLIAQDLILLGNDALESLDGLSALTIIGWDAYITQNPALTDISALSALTRIGKSLIIEHTALPNLDGLDNLADVGAHVYLRYNPELSDIYGLHHTMQIDSQLHIMHNPHLDYCGVQGVCDYLDYTADPANFRAYGNADGCFFRNQIEADCLAVATREPALEAVTLVPNPATDGFTITGAIEGQIDRIQITSMTGKVVWQQQALRTPSIDVHALPAGIYFVILQAGGQIVSKKLIKI